MLHCGRRDAGVLSLVSLRCVFRPKEEKQMHTRLLLTWTALSVISSGLAQNRADMILIPVTVLDYKGATVNGLDRERFTLLQDNVPQDIVSFSRNDLHCSVG